MDSIRGVQNVSLFDGAVSDILYWQGYINSGMGAGHIDHLIVPDLPIVTIAFLLEDKLNFK